MDARTRHCKIWWRRQRVGTSLRLRSVHQHVHVSAVHATLHDAHLRRCGIVQHAVRVAVSTAKCDESVDGEQNEGSGAFHRSLRMPGGHRLASITRSLMRKLLQGKRLNHTTGYCFVSCSISEQSEFSN